MVKRIAFALVFVTVGLLLGALLVGQVAARDEARRAVVKADDGGEVRALALEELRALTLPRFWLLPTVEQNQLLNRLLGNFRINVREGEVIGFVDTSQE